MIKPSSVALFCLLLVLGCYPVARVLLELTWMFPGSLLRYREKFQAAVLTQFAMLCTHLLYCWLHCWIRLKALMWNIVCWTMLCFNTAPQLELFVEAHVGKRRLCWSLYTAAVEQRCRLQWGLKFTPVELKPLLINWLLAALRSHYVSCSTWCFSLTLLWSFPDQSAMLSTTLASSVGASWLLNAIR